MSLLVWNPEWETGVGKIDRQHRDLLGQIEVLMTAIHADEAANRIPGLLDFLATYVDQHFRDEETEMATSSFPRTASHRAIHDEMRGQVARLLIQFKEDPAVITDEVLDFMTDWLVKHINEEDRHLARHLIRYASDHPEVRS